MPQMIILLQSIATKGAVNYRSHGRVRDPECSYIHSASKTENFGSTDGIGSIGCETSRERPSSKIVEILYIHFRGYTHLMVVPGKLILFFSALPRAFFMPDGFTDGSLRG